MSTFAAFLFLLFAVYECRALAVSHHHGHQWDHFVYAQQWPMTSCIDCKISHSHTCSIPKNVTTWTVHGLWPTEGTSEGPVFCNTSSHAVDFDPDSLSPILPQLIQIWPNLYADTELYSFWKHEWCKHGTCAISLDTINSELKYFQKGMELQKKFDLLSILKKASIDPTDDKTYEFTEFMQALADGLGATPKVSCVYDKETRTQYIAQIEFCISRSFEIMDCPTRHHRPAPSPLEMMPSHKTGYAVMSQKKTNRLQSPETCEQQMMSVKHRLSREEGCRDTEPIAYPLIKYTTITK